MRREPYDIYKNLRFLLLDSTLLQQLLEFFLYFSKVGVFQTEFYAVLESSSIETRTEAGQSLTRKKSRTTDKRKCQRTARTARRGSPVKQRGSIGAHCIAQRWP